MRKIVLIAPILLLTACEDSEAEKAAKAADYAKIVQATCFLHGFGPGNAQHDECIEFVGESTAAQTRLAEAAEMDAREFQVMMSVSQNIGESMREAAASRRRSY
jgi:hypothetical protein